MSSCTRMLKEFSQEPYWINGVKNADWGPTQYGSGVLSKVGDDCISTMQKYTNVCVYVCVLQLNPQHIHILSWHYEAYTQINSSLTITMQSYSVWYGENNNEA